MEEGAHPHGSEPSGFNKGYALSSSDDYSKGVTFAGFASCLQFFLAATSISLGDLEGTD
jgi:hypothetical protein